MRALLIALCLASLAMPALADPPGPLEPAFKGTIISTYPDGRQAKLWLNRDGSYRAEGRRHDPSGGHWKLKGEKICLSQSRPFPAPFRFCTPLPHGEVWIAKAVTGEIVQARVVKGR